MNYVCAQNLELELALLAFRSIADVHFANFPEILFVRFTLGNYPQFVKNKGKCFFESCEEKRSSRKAWKFCGLYMLEGLTVGLVLAFNFADINDVWINWYNRQLWEQKVTFNPKQCNELLAEVKFNDCKQLST